jgi:hypothetical protein
MPGGLMQLLSWGNQNFYLNGNPSITFFKKVYKTHTNFSMESIRINFNRNDVFVNDTTTLKAIINRHGDLVSQMYFVFELPDIEFDEDLVFRWIDYVGETIIDTCQLSINGNVIDRQTGEFQHLYRQLTYGVDKMSLLEKMTAYKYHLVPTEYKFTPYGTVVQNTFSTTIPSRKVYVPLNFWCNKTLAHAIPLIALQYSEVELTIDIRPLTQLYTLFYVKNGVSDYWAPNLNLDTHRFHSFVSNNRKRFLVTDTVVDLKAYLEVNYVFLDKAERNFFAYKPIEYLIEQTTRIERFNVSDSTIHDLILQNPVKEVMWACSRNDRNAKNTWFTYTDGVEPIMNTAKVMFNGLDRFDEKDATYFNYVQPFQHHRANYKEGLYVYSFSINADDVEQPSGSVNSSMINKIQLYMTTKRPNDQSYSYDCVFYVISYNLLRIEKGLGAIAFSK